MKMPIALTLLCLLVISIPGMAQNKPAEPGKPAHETVINGRWEVRPVPDKEPTASFEFKNEAGVVTGVVILKGKSTEIKNGSLEGANLKFETMELLADGGKMKMIWTGSIAKDSESLLLTCTAEPIDGASDGRAPQQYQARRVD